MNFSGNPPSFFCISMKNSFSFVVVCNTTQRYSQMLQITVQMGRSETNLWKVSLLAVGSFVGVVFACRYVYSAFQQSVYTQLKTSAELSKESNKSELNQSENDIIHFTGSVGTVAWNIRDRAVDKMSFEIRSRMAFQTGPG